LILADTHVLIWYRLAMPRLGKRARSRLEREEHRGAFAISALSFYEAENIASARRVDFGMPLDRWRTGLLTGGFVEWPVTGEIALSATKLPRVIRDPFDRMIIATALVHDATLLTADGAILDAKLPIRCEDATR